MTIHIPDKFLKQAGISPEVVKLELAVMLYQKEVYSLGQAARLAGIHRMAFQKELAKREIPFHYDEEMLTNDMQVLEKLRSKGSGTFAGNLEAGYAAMAADEEREREAEEWVEGTGFDRSN